MEIDEYRLEFLQELRNEAIRMEMMSRTNLLRRKSKN